MKIVGVIILIIFLTLLLVVFVTGMVQMWSPEKQYTDQDLYGMSGNAYALKEMGDEEFRKHFTEEEYVEAKSELDNLENRK